MPSSKITLVTANRATSEAVALALREADAPAVQATCDSLERLGGHLRRAPAAAALIDIDPDPPAALGRLASIVSQYPDTRFIVLADNIDSGLMLQAMEAGARHCLAKPAIRTDLCPVLRRLIADGIERTPARRNIVPVLAAGGGCGATTIAINLTNELHLLTDKPALLVDLDCHFGVADAYLGLKGDYGLTDVMTRPGDIDADLVRSTAVDYSDGFHLLRSCAAGNLPSETGLDRERLAKVIAACDDAYAFTVLDAPRIPMSLAIDLAANSAMTFIILQMTVKDLRVARSMLTALAKGDVPPERIVPVVNRYRKRGLMIGPEEARKALGRPFETICNDYRNTVRSINYGQPLEQTASRCQCRRQLRGLAEQVIQESDEPDAEAMTR